MNDKIKNNAEEILDLYKEAYNTFTGQNFSVSMDVSFHRYKDKISELSDGKVGIVGEMNNSNVSRGTYAVYLMANPDILEFLSQYVSEEDANSNWVRNWYKESGNDEK